MTARSGSARGGARWLFVLAILTGSFMLFLVQPMIARMALPRLGGAPAVWNSAMLVYQALLLGGYGYAHLLGRLPPRRGAALHLGVLLVAALWLPIGLVATTLPPDASPVLWVPWLLALSIGPLFFAVSAGAPLIQRWYVAASGGADPYPLYAASNLGSFAGLVAYPLVVEPELALRAQSGVWSLGYVLLIALIGSCALMLPRGSGSAEVPSSAAPGRARVIRWMVLALVPSGLMLATSTYITTDIVAMPLLWVLPLGLYLLSFTIAFAAARDLADTLTRFAPMTILIFGGVMIGGYQENAYLSAFVALGLLFMASVALHTALFRARPAADRLTGFYLATSVGGALGGVFAAVIAPAIFDWTYEYPLLILAAGALAPQVYLTGGLRRLWTGPRSRVALALVTGAVLLVALGRIAGPPALFGEDRQGIAFLVIASLGLATIGARLPHAVLLAAALLLFGGAHAIALTLEGGARTRSYFGVYTVRTDPRRHELDHGSTIHGVQLRGSTTRERTPTTYYARGSGVGQAMEALPELFGPGARVGVVGLGTGTLACYARGKQHWRFYEIDPAMVRIAEDPANFSFLARCLPHPAIRIGDARLSLMREGTATLDLLALDAFSSDAVPMHLLTREAFATYARVLAPRGLLLVHISNRFLDLAPVVAAAARQGGWHAVQLDHSPSTLDEAASPSWWIALSRDARSIATLQRRDARWYALADRPGFTGWTDDYATILPLVRALR